MKPQKGFTLIELMVSMGIVVSVVAMATGALMQAQKATTAVAYQANTQENLRAGMHFMVRDLMQAGEGIPQGGISLPYTVTSAVNRPGTATIFPNSYTTLPAVTPGWKAGQFAISLNPTTGAITRQGTIAERNTARLILDAAGDSLLAEIAAGFHVLMGTCFAVHEANGDLAHTVLDERALRNWSAARNPGKDLGQRIPEVTERRKHGELV